MLKERLAERIKRVLQSAKERKRQGIGVMARPEADVGLLPLYQVLHRLEPDCGWLEKALVTLAHTLHDALSQAQNIWWGEDWQHLGKKLSDASPLSLVEDCEAQVQSAGAAAAQLLPIVRGYLQNVENISNRSFSKDLASLNVAPLPSGTTAPEWSNPRDMPNWPFNEKKRKEKLGTVLMRTLLFWNHDALDMLNYGQQVLATNDRNSSTEHFLRVISLDRVSAKFAEVAYLDRIFGASAEDYLNALLGYSRFEHCQEIWSGRVAYFYAHVPTALAADDQEHLTNWAAIAQRESMPLGAGVGQMLLRMILQRDDIKISPLRKSDSTYFRSEYVATQGLLEKKAELIEEGVCGMLMNYHKTNYPVWRGNWLSEICVPAVAIQRAAIRSGMTIKIPAERPNDQELVQLPDSKEASLPFCLYPGIETVLAHRNLAWPSLLLDEPITTIVE